MTNEQNSKTKLIADTLREEAVSGCFPSGRFPSEAQVIRRFGVARQTAVKAKYKDYAGGHLYVYDPKTGDDDTYLGDAKAKVKDLGIPVPGNSIYAMVAVEKDAPKGKVLISATSEKVTKVYGISYPDAEFFEYDGKAFKRHGKWMEKLSYPGPERSRRV